MRIIDIIKSLKEDLELLNGESYQRHKPEYADEHNYYNYLCKLFEEIDDTASDLLRYKIHKKNKDYKIFNTDYPSYLQGLVGYYYYEMKYSCHDIVEKIIIPDLIESNKWLYNLHKGE